MVDRNFRPKPAIAGDEILRIPGVRPPGAPHANDTHDVAGHGGDGVNLRDYLAVIQRRKWTLASFLLLVLVSTVLASFLATPIYRATASLQIERELPKVVQFQDVVPVESALDKDFYQTQHELLRSRTLAKRVIDHLALDAHPAFTAARAPGLGAWLAGLVGVSLPMTDDASDEGTVIDAFLEDLSVEPVKQSRLVRISFSSSDPQLSAAVVNALAELFIQMNLERRVDASSYAKSFLDERLVQVKARLEDSEKKLVDFARANQIIKLDDSTSINTRKFNELAIALAAAERDRMDAEAMYEELRAASGQGVAPILDNPVIQRLKQTQAELQARYQDNLRIFKPGYPAMQQLRSQIDEIDTQIAAEIDNIRSAAQARFNVARQKEAALGAEMVRLKKEVLAVQDRSIQYSILQREVETNRQLYDGLLQRLKEIGVAGGVTTNNISIVDPAEVPREKFKPRLLVNVLLALLFGLAGGVAMVFLVEHLDDSLKAPEDIERRMHVPVLGVVPEVKVGKEKGGQATPVGTLAFTDPRSELAEAYRSIRTALLFSTVKGAPRVTLFTSPAPGEGKTTSALNLAITFTQTGKKVLLIDTDLRNPSLHRLLALDTSAGLTNYLVGDLKPAEVSQHTAITNLFAIPAGPLPPNPAELLSSRKLSELLDLAQEKFDFVILDGPPVLGLADALVLANVAHGTVVVVEAGSTRQGQLVGALKRLRSAHAAVVGCVMAKQKAHSGGYGYHQHYYYYQADRASATRPPAVG